MRYGSALMPIRIQIQIGIKIEIRIWIRIWIRITIKTVLIHNTGCGSVESSLHGTQGSLTAARRTNHSDTPHPIYTTIIALVDSVPTERTDKNLYNQRVGDFFWLFIRPRSGFSATV